jgi:hypothetical protein
MSNQGCSGEVPHVARLTGRPRSTLLPLGAASKPRIGRATSERSSDLRCAAVPRRVQYFVLGRQR